MTLGVQNGWPGEACTVSSISRVEGLWNFLRLQFVALVSTSFLLLLVRHLLLLAWHLFLLQKDEIPANCTQMPFMPL